MFNHGTLLWNTDLSVIGEALRVKQAKIESKGIKSVRSRVANITEFLPENPPDIMTFRQMIIDSVHEENPLEEYVLSETDWENIHQLSRERYQNWEWNFGKSPAFGIQREIRYEGGCVEAWLDISRGGVINQVKFYGDFSVSGMFPSWKQPWQAHAMNPQQFLSGSAIWMSTIISST